MIAKLEGKVAHRFDPYLIIDVNGVGYKVFASSVVLEHLNTNPDLVSIFTYTYVREDALELFGFLSLEELALFEQLISVSGIGPKTAIAIFSIGGKDEISDAIAKENVAFFTSVPRLGLKNAQKIIIELKGKISLASQGLSLEADQGVASALKAFGFSQKEINEAIKHMSQKERKDLDPASQVKIALKYLGK